MDKSLSEQEKLIRNIQNGSTSDFIQLVEPYYDKLFLTIRSIVGEKDDAKDVLQEVFISAYNALDSFKNESRIYTWLYRIAVNKAYDFLKKKKRESQYVDKNFNLYGDDADKFSLFYKKTKKMEEKYEQNELNQYLMNKIDELAPKYREIIMMRYFENLTYEEIAKIKNIKIGTVKSRLFKAKEILKKNLQNNDLLKDFLK